jgi:hypothetical protein
MAGVRFTELQSRPMEFLDFTSVTLAEFQPLVPRAGRCRGLCRYRDLLHLKVHVRIPALEDGAQFPVERPHSRL